VQTQADASSADDEAIRRALLAALERAPWWRGAEANVIVSEGVAHYWGAVDDEAHREPARAAALAVPGVLRVEDHRTPRKARAPAGGEEIRRAADRGHSKHGLVESWHSFSFGNYYDPAHLGYGPLRALNEKHVQPGAGRTTYGLRDVEVLTYVLAGEYVYDDSMDNHAVLSAGGVHHMSAGSGMRHSERDGSEEQACHFLQLWIEPHEIGVQPSCGQRRFSESERRGQLRLIASPDGRESSLRVHQDVLLYAGLFDRGERSELTIRPERRAYVHLARGRLTVNRHALGPGDALKSGSGPIVLSNGESAEVLVLDVPD
jgi:redox-sensitive bicupin YhaK (pirin superfamily)